VGRQAGSHHQIRVCARGHSMAGSAVDGDGRGNGRSQLFPHYASIKDDEEGSAASPPRSRCFHLWFALRGCGAEHAGGQGEPASFLISSHRPRQQMELAYSAYAPREI